MAIEQTIFDKIERGQRKRNYHKKTGGNKETRAARWQRFLRAVKLAKENGESGFLTPMQIKYCIGKFRADLLPSDLDTITYEDITLEYAKAVMNAVTEDYKRQQSRKNAPADTQEPQQVIVVPQSSIDAKKLIEDITNALDEFQSKLNQILTKYTKAK